MRNVQSTQFFVVTNTESGYYIGIGVKKDVESTTPGRRRFLKIRIP
jgi:hypothetical protein